jgi:hypothetical protein
MMHPWGGYYAGYAGVGYVHQPFSFWYALLDLLIIIVVITIVWAIIAACVRRSRRNRIYLGD